MMSSRLRHLLRPVVVVAATVLMAGLFGATTASAATSWGPEKSGSTVLLNDVALGGDATDIAVGVAGTILRKEGTGDWKSVKSGTTADLFAVTAAPGANASSGGPACGSGGTLTCFWAGGADGTVLFSNDDGKTWCPQQTGTTATIFALQNRGPSDVFAVGGGGLYMEAGPTGTAASGCGAAAAYTKLTSGTTNDLHSVSPVPDGSVIAVGDKGTIVKSTAPATTVLAAKTSGTAVDLDSVTANSDGSPSGVIGFVAVGAGGVVRRSTDGTTWAAGDSGTKNDLHEVALTLDNLKGYAVGALGTILNTSDGGATWAAETSGTCNGLFGSTWVFNSGGTAVGFRIAVGDNGTIIDDTTTPTGAVSCTGPGSQQTGSSGYRFSASDGGVFVFGNRPFNGSLGDKVLNKPIVGGATDMSDFQSYWLVSSDGGVFAFGPEGKPAPYYGSILDSGQTLDSPISAMKPTPTGKGYYLVSAKGKVYTFGDAKNVGDIGTLKLNGSIIGMTVTPSGLGYWLVGSDGGIFRFGDAEFFGSMGDQKLNAPVVDLGSTPDGLGYYLVGCDGGIFNFGDAVFRGSTGDLKLNKPVVAILVSPNGAGYWFAATDGGVFTFGPGVPFLGSTGDMKLNAPVNAFFF